MRRYRNRSNGRSRPGHFSRRSFETLEARQLLSVAPYDYPVIDLNGPAPSNNIESRQVWLGPAISVGDPAALTVTSSTGYLQSVHFTSSNFQLPFVINVDTSGTAIVASAASGEFILSGLDTVENYQAVLKNASVVTQFGDGLMLPLYVHAIDSDGVRGPRSYNLVTGLDPVTPEADLNSHLVIGALAEHVIVDLNGPEPGRDDEIDLYQGLMSQLVLDSALEIEGPPGTQLTEAFVDLGALSAITATVDTAGTNITATQGEDGLTLSGEDTLENYALVLRSLRLASVGLISPGDTYPVRITVMNGAGQSAPATALATVLRPPPPTIDLDGDPARDFFTTGYGLGDPPVPIVDPAGLTIHSPVIKTFGRADINIDYPGGVVVSVDTTGTSIQATNSGPQVSLLGFDTIENYQRVLRTLRFHGNIAPAEHARVVIILNTQVFSIEAESLVTVGGTLPLVLSARLFYNNSKYDGYDPSANSADAAAIAGDKARYAAGEGPAKSVNVTSYVHGINGLWVDVADLTGPIAVDDFAFKIGNNNAPDTWTAAPLPSEFTVLPYEGQPGWNRILMVWPDGAIKNTWLQVTVEGNDASGGFNTNTGLAASDVFYFGSRVGDTFAFGTEPEGVFLTSSIDQIGVRQRHAANVLRDNAYDFNKDGLVSAADEIIARNNLGFLMRLNLPSPSVEPAAAASDDGLARRALPDQSTSALTSALAVRQAARPFEPERFHAVELRVAEQPGSRLGEVSSADRARWRAVDAALETVDEGAAEDELLADLLPRV